MFALNENKIIFIPVIHVQWKVLVIENCTLCVNMDFQDDIGICK